MLSNHTIKKDEQIERVEVKGHVKNNKFYNFTINKMTTKKVERL